MFANTNNSFFPFDGWNSLALQSKLGIPFDWCNAHLFLCNQDCYFPISVLETDATFPVLSLW